MLFRSAPESLDEILKMDETRYLETFAGTPVTRTGLEGLKRNARRIQKENKLGEETN